MDEYDAIKQACQKIIDFIDEGKEPGLFMWKGSFFELVGNLYETLKFNGYHENNFIKADMTSVQPLYKPESEA